MTERLSNSRAWVYAKCPWAYGLKYLLKIYPLAKTMNIDAWERFTRGILIHGGLEAAFLGQNVAKGVREALRDEGELSDDQKLLLPVLLSEAEQIANDVAEWLPATDFEPLLIKGQPAVEFEVTAKLPGWDGGYIGYVDLVARHRLSGRVFVIDWKSKASFSQESGLRWTRQFRLYAYVLAQLGIKTDGALMVEIKSSTPKRAPRKHREDSGDFNTVRESADGRFRASPEFFSQTHLENTWKSFLAEARVMSEATLDKCYMNESPFNCGTCEYEQICAAKLRGYDLKDVLMEGYKVPPASLKVLCG